MDNVHPPPTSKDDIPPSTSQDPPPGRIAVLKDGSDVRLPAGQCGVMTGSKEGVKEVSKTGRKADGVRANVSKPDPGCSYVKGWCKKHGGGAKKHWRPKWVRVKGVDGKFTMKMTHQTYYVCDLSLEAGTRLRQTRLSLTDSGRAVSGTGRGALDISDEGGLNISTSTVGQSSSWASEGSSLDQ